MQRHPPFDKAVNFRDLGGYATTDGGMVRWNRVYRCGHMARLTDDDIARLKAMNAHAICDFRSQGERDRSPSRLPDDLAALIHHLEIWPKAGNSFADFVTSFKSGELDMDTFLEIQRASYREFVTAFAHQYAKVFRLLEAADGRPVVMHCTAGKDRTGIGSALILLALGVPEETVHADYLLSNQCADLHQFVAYLMDQRIGGTHAGETEDARLARMLDVFGAQIDRLHAACDAMRDMGGSIDGYLRDALGLDESRRAKMKKLLVEN